MTVHYPLRLAPENDNSAAQEASAAQEEAVEASAEADPYTKAGAFHLLAYRVP